MSSHSTINTRSFPFQFAGPVEDFDVIVRSKDDLDFHAHRVILKRVSPSFVASLKGRPSVSDLPVLQLSADGATVDLLLQHIYPDCTPDVIEELDQLLSLLELSTSHGVHVVTNRLRRQLVNPSFLESHAIRIFAAASHWGLAEEAEIAAEATGTTELSSVDPENLQGVSAVDYVRLMKRHQRRTDDLVKALEFWMSRRCKSCQLTNSWASQYRIRALTELHRAPSTKVIFSDEFVKQNASMANCPRCDNQFLFREHWKDLEELCQPSKMSYSNPPRASPTLTASPQLPEVPLFREGDCILRSSDSRKVYAYRRILREASPFWNALFSLPQSGSIPQGQEAGTHLPIIDCVEDYSTLCLLLQMIYPITKPKIQSLDELEPVLEAAQKFEMEAAFDYISTLLLEPRFLHEDAVRVYALATRYEFTSVARLATSHALRCDLDKTAEHSVVGLSATSFMQLVQWRNARAQRILGILIEQRPATCRTCEVRWTGNWLRAAVGEILRRPVGDTIFSLPFLLSCFQPDRGVSSMASHHCTNTLTDVDRDWLQGIKAQIDYLPEEMEV